MIKEMGADSVRLQWSRAELPYYVRQTAPITYAVEMQEVRGSACLIYVVVVAFASFVRIFGECLAIHSPPVLFFFFLKERLAHAH